MKKQLLFIAIVLMALVTGCDKSEAPPLPPSPPPPVIEGVELPTSTPENPVFIGSPLTIKGKGFTQSSEIWFRVATKATEGVKAIITSVDGTQITFIAPEVVGSHSVVLKQNGEEQILGEMFLAKDVTPGPDDFITEVEMPVSNADNPINAGSPVTIKGKGFTEASEILFRVVTKATEDAEATITEVTETSITFTAPELEGLCSVVVKQDDKEQVLGNIYITNAVLPVGKITYLNVEDAKSLFNQNSVQTRSNGNGEWMKVDADGKKSKLTFLDGNKNELSGEISRLKKLTEKYLIVQYYDADHTVHDLLVNAETGKVYLIKGLDNGVWNAKQIQEQNGAIYCLSLSYPSKDQIIKIDPIALTVSKMMADGQDLNSFYVDKKGYILYSKFPEYFPNTYSKIEHKVRYPGGAIAPDFQFDFAYNGEFYFIDKNSIYKWITLGDNYMEKELVVETISDEYHYTEQDQDGYTKFFGCLDYNHQQNSIILFYGKENSGYSNAERYSFFDFNGTDTPAEITNKDAIAFMMTHKKTGAPNYSADWRNESYITKSAMLNKYEIQYFDNDGVDYSSITKLNLSNYTTSIVTIPSSAFDVTHISTTLASPDITFTGVQYSDGRNILGSIDGNNNLDIISTMESGYEVTDMIPLN